MGSGPEQALISGLPASPQQLARESATIEEIELLAELIIRANQAPERLANAEIDEVLSVQARAVA